ncbi:ABC transporter substrate-binding protein [Roseibium sp.]|uniref:ABC transporter substrate-binding protein n=1 Tax=Roseibium sp. TaxID=1936156 RepID=UPI003B52FF69
MITVKTALTGAILSMALSSATQAETVNVAFQGSLNSLDPYSLNETFTLGMLGNVYEGLIRRDETLKIEPALAESWEVISPKHWRFHLRKNVKFHNGNDFTAEDVVYSMDRARSEGSNLGYRIPEGAEVVAVDDYTVDFLLKAPSPIMHSGWETLYIMDKEWTVENEAETVASASDNTVNYATLNANGTGPFRVVLHEPDIRTSFENFENWWDTAKHNLTAVEFKPIKSDATRVAALLTGEMDLVFPVPVQDLKRIRETRTTKALTGSELRTVFLGLDQKRDELLYSDVKGKNPFKDVRVRKAFNHAVNIEAIRLKIMRELSSPTALMISPLLFSKSDQFERHPYDIEAAKKLMSEAGYPDGFSVVLDCPNDRYVNDEAICQAVAAMLARIGVKVDLNAMPKALYFAKILSSGGFDTSFYMLGWTPSTLESSVVLKNLMNCRDDEGQGASYNIGGWCDPEIDALTSKLTLEPDLTKRDELIEKAFRIAHDKAYYLPLHQQALAWGTANNIVVSQRADNQLLFRFMTKN